MPPTIARRNKRWNQNEDSVENAFNKFMSLQCDPGEPEVCVPPPRRLKAPGVENKEKEEGKGRRKRGKEKGGEKKRKGRDKKRKGEGKKET